MARAGWQAARPLLSSWLDTVCEEGAEAEGAEEGEASGASPLARYFAALVSERRLDQLGLAISFLARRVEAMPSGGQGAAALGKLVLPLADLVDSLVAGVYGAGSTFGPCDALRRATVLEGTEKLWHVTADERFAEELEQSRHDIHRHDSLT
mmetsp:Transcript_24946/g.78404  ORF Transcript_24946/g.78404 Transcript_24946/m.78404 type:complete len:152 (+) Transcript_24946:412-867(+)